VSDERYQRERILPFQGSFKGRAELEAAIALLRERRALGPILDLGCGPGLNLGRVRRAFPSERVFGVDISRAAVRIAAAAGVVRADAHRICFPDGSFSAVLLTHVLGHLAEPDAALREVRRILRPSGVLVLTTPNLRFVEVLRPFNERGLLPYRPDETVLRFYDEEELRAALLGAGFEVERLEPFGAQPALAPDLAALLPPGVRTDDPARRERLLALATSPAPSGR
jgi:SAM-dependent methyltransferase